MENLFPRQILETETLETSWTKNHGSMLEKSSTFSLGAGGPTSCASMIAASPTQKNQHQKPQNTQLDTHRQNHTNPLTAKHKAKYSKFGNGARTGPRGFLYLVVFT